jgi:hypothetical protein
MYLVKDLKETVVKYNGRNIICGMFRGTWEGWINALRSQVTDILLCCYLSLNVRQPSYRRVQEQQQSYVKLKGFCTVLKYCRTQLDFNISGLCNGCFSVLKNATPFLHFITLFF